MEDPSSLLEPGFKNPVFEHDPNDDVDELPITDEVDELDRNAETERDLYAILNIQRTATDEQIKDAYRRLSKIYHPDRHSNSAANRKVAETKFPEIQRAHEILTDKEKRAVYDMFGEEGLKHKWTVGPRLKTPEEMRAEFAKQAQAKKFAEVENMVRPKGDITLNINAYPLFCPNDPQVFRNPTVNIPVLKRFTMCHPQVLHMGHAFEVRPHNNVAFIINGFMTTQFVGQNRGFGNIRGTTRMQISPKLWVEVSAAAIKPYRFTSRGLYQIDKETYFTFDATVPTFLSPPIMNMTAGRRIGEGVNGYFTFRTGYWTIPGIWDKLDANAMASRVSQQRSSATLGIQRIEPGVSYQGELTAGIIASSISTEMSRRVWDLFRLQLGSVLSTDAFLTSFIGGEGFVTTHTRLGLRIDFGVITGTKLSITVKRLGQKIHLPIVVAPSFKPGLVFWLASIPAMTVAVLDRLWIRPRKHRSRDQKLKDLRHHHAEYLEKRQKDAQEAIRLMEDAIKRRRQQEEAIDGLVIVYAYYGSVNAIEASKVEQDDGEKHTQMNGNTDAYTPNGDLSDEIADVTIPVQGLVTESQLNIPGGYSKHNILGFYDPCLGEKKRLKIRYRFHGQLHEAIVDDKATLVAPLRSHQI